MSASQKTYDLFASYKSEDVHLARRLAEVLLASGYRLWFAEYNILLTNYDRFQDHIDAAIARSRYGLCLTNDRYVSSPYVQREIELLLQRPGYGPENIIEVMIPREEQVHRRYPDLAGACIFEHESLTTTLARIGDLVGLPVIPIPAESTAGIGGRQHFRDGRQAYSLDLAGWDVSTTPCLPASDGDREGPRFMRYCNGRRLWGNLIIGDRVDSPRSWDSTIDDREAYRYAIDFGKAYFYGSWWRRLLGRPVGLHLCFVEGTSHMAVTSRGWLGTWARRYSVVLPRRSGPGALEFAFVFFCRGSFTDFCRHAYLMDKLVNSLRLWG